MVHHKTQLTNYNGSILSLKHEVVQYGTICLIKVGTYGTTCPV